MKIKTKKEMNLPELIEWAIKKDIKDEKFYSKNGCHISIDYRGHVFLWDIRLNEIFTVETEEPITALTNLDTLVEVRESGIVHTHYDTSIREEERDSTVEFHTLIEGKLVLIWDREEGLVE